MSQAALKQYQSVGVQSGVTDASPHQLIAMLFAGILDRVAAAKGAIARGDVQRRGESLSRAIAIVDSLRASLDHQAGGDISGNLGDLYDYIEQRLVQANVEADGAALEEVTALVLQLRAGWDAIPPEHRGGRG